MKTPFQPLAIAVIGSFIFACDQDPLEEEGNGTSRTTVQFQTGSKQIAENGAEETLSITFNKPASADGVLNIKTGNPFDNAFTTTPPSHQGVIKIEVRKGDASASLKMHPTDNAEEDGHHIVSLTLDNLEEPFIAGAINTLSIRVTDDETIAPNLESLANFINQDNVLEEVNQEGIEYQIHFSEAVAVASEVKITLTSPNGTYGTHFVTAPHAENNVVTLPVTAGLRVVGFKMIPVANNDITGELSITMTITGTSGSIRKGHNLEESLLIKDDELAGKPKGYEVAAGNSILKKFVEYDTQGRIARVNWESYSPYYTHGTDTYHYDGNGRLAKINKYPGRDVFYEWRDGRIVKSNDIWNGVLHSYADYEYDGAGNVGGVASYYRQQDGTYLKGLFTVYLYFTDGNIYKSLTYQDTENPEEPFLLSTRTYENYIDGFNPFPMTEVLPGVRMQTKLPTSYRIEENGLDKTYYMVYEYRPDGLPEKRIASTSGDTQTAVYHYY